MQRFSVASAVLSKRAWAVTCAGLACAIALLIASVPLTTEVAVAQDAAEVSSERKVWVPVTQQTVAEPFLTAWLSIYGVNQLGMPISGVTQIEDGWAQWFDFGRLEVTRVALDTATPSHVSLAPIGRTVAEKMGYDMRLPEFQPRTEPGPDGQFFAETGHILRGGFLEFYETSGVSDWIGQPISEEFSFGGAVFQYFEYGALSLQPELGVQEEGIVVLDAHLNAAFPTPHAQPEDAMLYGSAEFLALHEEAVREVESFTLSADAAEFIALSNELGGERWIEIDLSDFRLTAYAGETPVLETTVVTGHVNAETPTGEFAIWLKYERQDMSGIGWNGEPYFEAGIPWAMYFFEDYAIHGTTWRTSYGIQDSQGCVIPPNDVAELLFSWANLETRVVVQE